MSSVRDPVAVPVTFVVIVADNGCAGTSPPGPARIVNVAPGIGIEDGVTLTAADGSTTTSRSRTALRTLAAIAIARAGEPRDGAGRRAATLASADLMVLHAAAPAPPSTPARAVGPAVIETDDNSRFARQFTTEWLALLIGLAVIGLLIGWSLFKAHDVVDAPAVLYTHASELKAARELWPKIEFHTMREHGGLVVHSEKIAA